MMIYTFKVVRESAPDVVVRVRGSFPTHAEATVAARRLTEQTGVVHIIACVLGSNLGPLSSAPA